MLTVVIAGAVIFQSIFDAIRRFVLMRTAVEVAARMGAPVLSAAAHASLHGTGREYQTLGDLQQLRSFLTSGTLLSFLDVPFAPLFILAIYFVHPHLGTIVVVTALVLFVIALINQKVTSRPFAEANLAQSKANQHLDSMSRNSQIINALAMIPEAVSIWGRDTAQSLTAQVRAQDRNIVSASISRACRLLTQIAMLGWGAFLAIDGQITGGMVIAGLECVFAVPRLVRSHRATAERFAPPVRAPSPAAAGRAPRRRAAALRSGWNKAGYPKWA